MKKIQSAMMTATDEYAEGGSLLKFVVKYYTCFIAGLVILTLARK